MLQKDTKNFYNNDKYSKQQFAEYFPNSKKYVEEFDGLWDSVYLEDSIECHSDYGGEIAGSGTLDYVEAKAIYLFVRNEKPELIMEIGTAQGISACVICEALERNKKGKLITIDNKPAHRPSDYFILFQEKGLIEVVIQDAIRYLSRYSGKEPDILFLDADHRKPFCDNIISLFKSKFKNTKYLYHEWSLSVNASTPEIDYVSRREWLFQFHERASFEKIMPDKTHYGIVGSCGLGICI